MRKLWLVKENRKIIQFINSKKPFLRLLIPLFVQLYKIWPKMQQLLILKLSKMININRRFEWCLIWRVIDFVIMSDLIFASSFIGSIKNNSGLASLHIIAASILKRWLALARFKVLVTFVKNHWAIWTVSDQLNVISHINSDKYYVKEIFITHFKG